MSGAPLSGGSRFSTVAHVDSPVSKKNFERLRAKWPRFRITDAEHKWVDLTECRFFGDGGHEIALFTFGRHVRLAQLTGRSTFPVWFTTNAHYWDNWHDAQGAPYVDVEFMGMVRGLRAPTGFVEPLRVLAIASCSNARFVYDEALRRALPTGVEQPPFDAIGNPRFRRLDVAVERLEKALRESLALPCPKAVPILRADDGAALWFGMDSLWERAATPWPTRAVNFDCPTIGTGDGVVYAYTFEAIAEAAALARDERYPLKIGSATRREDLHATHADAVVSRINAQLLLYEPVRVLAMLRCQKGRATEREIHGRLKAQKIQCPATEWFATNAEQVRAVMAELGSA